MSNFAALDPSVKRSLGAQIAKQISKYDPGTVFGRFILDFGNGQ